ncbi:MAG: DUF116 domain-containing protein [Pseudomonadota bacterium]
MNHLKEYQSDKTTADGRALGDEWADWNGKDGGTIDEGKGLFLSAAAAVLVSMGLAACIFVYLITPRLAGWWHGLPLLTWLFAICSIVGVTSIFILLALTTTRGRNFFPLRLLPRHFLNLVFLRAFRLAGLFGVSRDRMGHSFVRVSNDLSRAMKETARQEKLLILLPRCLSKEDMKGVDEIKARYPVEVHVVSGGELARKKVRETKPTAVIGVACERDLVSGIRDVGQKMSVIGIPNRRPEGPCKNTRIDMPELVRAVEFYVGPPKIQNKFT